MTQAKGGGGGVGGDGGSGDPRQGHEGVVKTISWPKKKPSDITVPRGALCTKN